MPPMLAKCLVAALMTSVLVSLGLFCGVQPSRRLSLGPTVAPFGEHRFSGMTPVFVDGSNAPYVALGAVGSTTSSPPWHVTGGTFASKLQPFGLFAITGSDV